MRLLDRLERRFRHWAVPNLTLLIVIGQSVSYLAAQQQPKLPLMLALIPSRVLDGEYWRIFSLASLTGVSARSIVTTC